MMRVGVIGFGARAEGVISNFKQFEMDAKVVAVYDLNPEVARDKLRHLGYRDEEVTFYDDLDDMLQNGKLDGVMVATNCDTHTDLAIKVMRYNLPMFLEKPVAIHFEEIQRLKEAAKHYTKEAVVSFPLRVSTLCQLAKEIIDSGKLGSIEQVQAVNNVTYGSVYYHDWYRNEDVTGGLFLQKATHDLDYINYLLGLEPKMLCAMESKQIFTGTKKAGLKCSQCEDYRTCTESPYSLTHNQFGEASYGEGCSFGVDTGNHDSASIMVQYETGMHSVYTQNFFVRKDAGKRGARLIGYKGTLEFDWVTGELKVFHHMQSKIETHVIKNNHLYHYGGDKVLCENFIEVMKGIAPSKAPLEAGIQSALMCLCARESAKTHQFKSL